MVIAQGDQNELSSLRDARDAEGDEELQSTIAVTVGYDQRLVLLQ